MVFDEGDSEALLEVGNGMVKKEGNDVVFHIAMKDEDMREGAFDGAQRGGRGKGDTEGDNIGAGE